MEYHPTVKKITSLLTENKCWFETFEHAPVRTSEEASKLRTGYTMHQGAKAIIARVKESGKGKYFAMFVVPGDRKFDPAKIKDQFRLFDIDSLQKKKLPKLLPAYCLVACHRLEIYLAWM